MIVKKKTKYSGTAPARCRSQDSKPDECFPNNPPGRASARCAPFASSLCTSSPPTLGLVQENELVLTDPDVAYPAEKT